MDIIALVKSVQEARVLEIDQNRLTALLSTADIIFEQDTLISGIIRILKVPGGYLTQETTDKNKIVLRFHLLEIAARALTDDHLNTYNMMWDGCGCKVKYYD